MTFASRMIGVLNAIKTSLETSYPDASIHIGSQTDEAPKSLDIAILPGRTGSDGRSGLWTFPVIFRITTSQGSSESDSLTTSEGILESLQDFFASNNAEPLTDSTYWGVMNGLFPVKISETGYFNKFVIESKVYLYESEYGSLGSITLAYDTYSITLSVGLSVTYNHQKPDIKFHTTSYPRPTGVDRRGWFVDFNISAILIGSSAYTDANNLVDLLEEQLGNMASNYWTISFSGYLATIFGSSRSVAPAPGNCVKVRLVDGDQFVVRVTGLSLREVRT